MIEITKEMREKKQKKIDELCGRIDANIRWAISNNRTKVCFPVDKYDEFYSEVREMYEKEGYKIIPTGYIGGVWQLTEDITW